MNPLRCSLGPAVQRYFALLIYLLTLALPAGPAWAQEGGEDVPARTVAAREALAGSEWKELEPGLSALMAMTGDGLAMTAFRVDPAQFTFAAAVQTKPTGERVDALGTREEAVIAVNGGFFGILEKSAQLFPVGLLRRAGHDYSKAWNKTGGLLLLAPDGSSGPVILPSGNDVPDSVADIIQSKPLLIEPGGKWAMNSNQEHLRKRMIVCLPEGGEVVLFAVTRGGMSLFEAGWLMRSADEGGVFGCDAALALDGGGSTQIWVDGHEEWSFRGETEVHNALIVRRR